MKSKTIKCQICGEVVSTEESSVKYLVNYKKKTGIDEMRTCGSHTSKDMED